MILFYVGPIFAPTLEIDYVSHPNMINLKWAHPRFCKNLPSLIWLGVDPTCASQMGFKFQRHARLGQTRRDSRLDFWSKSPFRTERDRSEISSTDPPLFFRFFFFNSESFTFWPRRLRYKSWHRLQAHTTGSRPTCTAGWRNGWVNEMSMCRAGYLKKDSEGKKKGRQCR